MARRGDTATGDQVCKEQLKKELRSHYFSPNYPPAMAWDDPTRRWDVHRASSGGESLGDTWRLLGADIAGGSGSRPSTVAAGSTREAVVTPRGGSSRAVTPRGGSGRAGAGSTTGSELAKQRYSGGPRRSSGRHGAGGGLPEEAVRTQARLRQTVAPDCVPEYARNAYAPCQRSYQLKENKMEAGTGGASDLPSFQRVMATGEKAMLAAGRGGVLHSRASFLMIDADGDGVITAAELRQALKR